MIDVEELPPTTVIECSVCGSKTFYLERHGLNVWATCNRCGRSRHLVNGDEDE